MNKIGILYIGIGSYLYFWEDFYKSFEANFLPEAQKEYFVFTDADTVPFEAENERIHRVYQENLGWPGNTLHRFRMFLGLEERLRQFDYIFFMNANLYCLQTVHEADILPGEGELLVVKHPRHLRKRPYQYPYDRNKKSLAYVPYKCLEAKEYVLGGINGGSPAVYLAMAAECNRRIEEDLKRGVIAAWHDESQLNRYIIDYPSYRLGPPSFCYQEGWSFTFAPVILARTKEDYVTLDETKANPPVLGRVRSRLRGMRMDFKYWRLARYFRRHGA